LHTFIDDSRPADDSSGFIHGVDLRRGRTHEDQAVRDPPASPPSPPSPVKVQVVAPAGDRPDRVPPLRW